MRESGKAGEMQEKHEMRGQGITTSPSRIKHKEIRIVQAYGEIIVQFLLKAFFLLKMVNYVFNFRKNLRPQKNNIFLWLNQPLLQKLAKISQNSISRELIIIQG